MPTVILLDVSFSMCQRVPGSKVDEGGNALLKKELAAAACCQMLDHLQQTNKLEFVALVRHTYIYNIMIFNILLYV